MGILDMVRRQKGGDPNNPLMTALYGLQDPANAQAPDQAPPSPVTQPPAAPNINAAPPLDATTTAPSSTTSFAAPRLPAPLQPTRVPTFDEYRTSPEGKAIDAGFTPYNPQGKWSSLGEALAYGLAETGGALNGHSGVGARLMEQSNEMKRAGMQRNVAHAGMVRDAYNSSITNAERTQQMAAQVHQSGTQDYEMQQQMLARAAGIYDFARKSVQGNMNPDQVRRMAKQMAVEQGVNINPDELENAITGTAPAPPKFTLGPSGMPEPIIYQGKQYGITPEAGEPPEVTKARQDAISSHEQIRSEKRSDEAYVAGNAAERQGRTIEAAIRAANVGEANKTLNAGREQALKHLNDMRAAQNQLQLVKDLSSSSSPTDQTSLAFKALGLDLPDGVHRINETELNAIRNQGSLSDRAYRTLLNWQSGDQFAPEILQDISATAEKIANSKIKNANDNLEDVNRVYGYKVQGAGQRGRFDEQAQGDGGGAPQKGATQTVSGVPYQFDGQRWVKVKKQ